MRRTPQVGVETEGRPPTKSTPNVEKHRRPTGPASGPAALVLRHADGNRLAPGRTRTSVLPKQFAETWGCSGFVRGPGESKLGDTRASVKSLVLAECFLTQMATVAANTKLIEGLSSNWHINTAPTYRKLT